MTGQQVLLGKDLLGKDPLGNDLPEKDLLEKGFQLAYFILPNRAAAIQVVIGAMNKLKAQRGRESRRTYWRDKHLKRGITRITRDEQDALQWLIFYEADQYEADRLASNQLPADHLQAGRPASHQHEASREKSEQHTLRDLVVRYIVNLVRMTTAMSSFHVNVGMHRLLHNYSTVETQRVYEALTERYLGADEYRRAKSVLMAKLEKRFGGLLRTVRAQHGEMRFEAEEDQTRWAALVDSCLKMFTPWSTNRACPVPSNYDASREKPPARLSGKGLEQMDPNEIEINRCHAFIDPVCYGRLMHALTFDAPGTRLALPRFFMDTNNSDHSNNSPQPARLSPEERKQITDQLSAQEKKRSAAVPHTVAVMVDGVERERLDLGHLRECSFEIEEGAELIELRTPGEGQDLLLAVYPVLYQETAGMAASQATLFRKGLRKLDLRIVPGPQAAQGPRHAVVTLRYVSNPFAALWPPSPDRPAWRLASVYSATALALVALGWALGTVRHKYQVQLQSPAVQGAPAKAVEQVPPAKIVEQAAVAPPNVTARPAQYAFTLAPDESRLRGAGSADIPSVSVPSHPVVIELSLPVPAAYARKSFRASLQRFLKPRVILTANMLKAHKTSSGHVVVLPLPSVMLENREDYLVELRALGSGGEFEEISTYTFHAEKKL